MQRHKLFIALTFCLVSLICRGQILDRYSYQPMADSVTNLLRNSSFFRLYNDNYIAAGTTLKDKPDSHNSDAKFNVAMAFRLTNTRLPWDTYLYFTYSQLVMWNIFEDSFPMRDLNFNPALMVSKPFYKDDRFIGLASLIFEHESNGKADVESRSWNRISLSGSFLLTNRMMLMCKLWIPIVDGENNGDLTDYRGFFKVGMAYQPIDRLTISANAQQRKGFMRFNTTVEVSWQIHRKSNLCLFTQFYDGYGESLLDYNKYDMKIRAGIVFKPNFIFSTL